MTFQHLLSRKFISGMTVIIGANIAVGFDWIQEDAYKTIILASLAIYYYVNDKQKATEKKVVEQ